MGPPPTEPRTPRGTVSLCAFVATPEPHEVPPGAVAAREPAHIPAAVGGRDALARPKRPNRKRRRRA